MEEQLLPQQGQPGIAMAILQTQLYPSMTYLSNTKLGILPK